MVLDLEADDEVQLANFSAALGLFLEEWAHRIDSTDVDLIMAFGLVERAAECAGAYGLRLDEFRDLASCCLDLGRDNMQELRCALKGRRLAQAVGWSST